MHAPTDCTMVAPPHWIPCFGPMHCQAQPPHRDLLLEAVQGDPAVHARIAVRGQHVVGAARIVPNTLRGPAAQKDGAGILQQGQPLLCVLCVHNQVLGCIPAS